MKVKVQLFAAAKELARTDRIDVELPEGATVSVLSETIGRQCPELHELLPVSRIAVNQEFALSDLQVHDADEIALIPPVSGG